jgi:predicted heme/steroid binding protein
MGVGRWKERMKGDEYDWSTSYMWKNGIMKSAKIV